MIGNSYDTGGKMWVKDEPWEVTLQQPGRYQKCKPGVLSKDLCLSSKDTNHFNNNKFKKHKKQNLSEKNMLKIYSTAITLSFTSTWTQTDS